jgi:hypothetical protein
VAKGISTAEDERLIRDDTADWGKRASAIFNVAVDGWEHLEADIARLLDHEWDGLRGEALSALVLFWKKDAYLPRAFRMLADDPEKFARAQAASALAGFARSTDREREKILRALGRTVHSDPEPFVVRAAYVGMLRLLAPDRKTSTLPDEDFTRDRDVDWKLLQPYLPN